MSQPDNNTNIQKDIDAQSLLKKYEESDIFGKLDLKISFPKFFKNQNWPILNDSQNFEYSYNQNCNKLVYYYCRSKKVGCSEPKMIIDIQQKKVYD